MGLSLNAVLSASVIYAYLKNKGIEFQARPRVGVNVRAVDGEVRRSDGDDVFAKVARKTSVLTFVGLVAGVRRAKESAVGIGFSCR